MEPKYIAAWGAAEVLSIPHAQFIALLRKNREMLPLALNGEAIKQKFGTANLSDRIEILREDMEEFYSGNVASEYILSFACLAVQDVQEYKRQQRESLKRDKARNDLSFQLAEARTLIAALEQDLAACREQLEEAQRANPSGNEEEGFFEAYPVCKLIYDLHLAGKNQAEIRAELTARRYTNAQAGFITQEDTIPRSDDTIKQSVKRSKRSLEG